MVDFYCHSCDATTSPLILGIDDAVDIIHGARQLSFWNSFDSEPRFLAMQIYDISVWPVAMALRIGWMPAFSGVTTLLARLLRRFRRHSPNTHFTLRGDIHYAGPKDGRVRQ